MARRPISISLEPDLIERVDRIAEARGETRTDVIERAILNALDGEEKLLHRLENPVFREVVTRLMAQPEVLDAIGAVVSERISLSEMERMRAAAPRLKEAGKRRASKRKGQST